MGGALTPNMPAKMRAAVVEAFGKPLVLRELDIPAPGPGQILVKVTRICTPRTVTGRWCRRSPSFLATRRSGSRPPSARA